jgi:hypothetical protein
VIVPSVDPVSKVAAGSSGGLGEASEYSAIALGEVSGVSLLM